MSRPPAGTVVVRLQEPARWAGGPSTWARGRAFCGDKLLDAPMLVRQFEAAEDRGALVALARSLTGHYAIVGQGPAGAFAVADRVRSHPVFYHASADGLVLTDSPSPAAPEGPAPPEALADFAYAGYVTGLTTLVKGVNQVPAATVLTCACGRDRANEIALETYDAFMPRFKDAFQNSDSDLLDMAHEALSNAMDRLLTILDGRAVVLPLSSGYDSRLLAMMLKVKNYDRVICFSYGKQGNRESSISRLVADELGFPWLFVPYSERQWREWTQSRLWREYIDMAHRGVSLPLMQGWPSAGFLRQHDLVPDDSVFVPGLFGGGVTVGYHAKKDLAGSRDVSRLNVAQRIVDDSYRLWWDEPARSIDLAGVVERIADQLIPPGCCDWESEASAYEHWIDRELVVKFVGNGGRVYEFWDYDWWLPFADEEVRAFWQRVPYAKRIEMKLYKRFVLAYSPDLVGASTDSILRHRKKEDHRARKLARRLDSRGLLRTARNRARPPVDSDVVYSSHPLGLWGAVDPAVFHRQFTGREIIYSFMTQAILETRYGWSRGQAAGDQSRHVG